MRALVFCMTALAAVIVFSGRASAHEAALDAYARVLRYFNPRLEDAPARALAAVTIESADEQRIDARLLVAVIAVESRWNAQAVSAAGARGLGQLMPQTAAALGVDPDDAEQNIAGAARHLRALLDRFADLDAATRVEFAVAAYNAGVAAVERYDGVPPYAETRAYVRRVITLWRRLSAAGPDSE